MTLTAPKHLRGRMNRWTPQALRDERREWALARGKEGHTVPAIAEALGIARQNARTMLTEAGYSWHAQPRMIRHPKWGNA
ncbi:hypothetical protein SAMN04489858_12040 [Paracoccus homiensis]|uniref:Homeodomain-like domain-containing protein n=2 Tax=Paracoccus homiensis TaxID=364199 RepID=A0A1I0IZI3_9RHOB|nr:hypothetical protein SAMN04489858_12040 [Paracoccus homiensis]